jgi:hypothetical protein
MSLTSGFRAFGNGTDAGFGLTAIGDRDRAWAQYGSAATGNIIAADMFGGVVTGDNFSLKDFQPSVEQMPLAEFFSLFANCFLANCRQLKMHRSRRDKEKQRFYLLPGQGGKLYRKKQKIFILWSLAAAAIVSGIIAVIMYFTNRNFHL